MVGGGNTSIMAVLKVVNTIRGKVLLELDTIRG